MEHQRAVIIYVLHSGNLYGTEKMALATLDGLTNDFDVVLFAPAGPVHTEAKKRGMPVVEFHGRIDLLCQLQPWISKYSQIVFAATGIIHSLAFLLLNFFYQKRACHAHLVHGGSSENHSYGRKKILNFAKVVFIAVSGYVQNRLISNGVLPEKICVIENFLPRDYLATVPRHPKFIEQGIHDVVVVSRLDPLKRVDLLIDALDSEPTLDKIRFRILGGGASDKLIARAKRHHSNLIFEGYCTNIPEILAQSDLLLHTCPCESFGLVVLEAMAAGIPTLVPDQGGAAALVDPGHTGWHFRANDFQSLAEQLKYLSYVEPDVLNRVVSSADRLLELQYSSNRGIEEYRNLFQMKL
ncbi:MAG: glycosyltransferase family 4 protein [Chlorobium sp.]|nr:glycosyltransferase family 4 protein [Chlorobium sp.]